MPQSRRADPAQSAVPAATRRLADARYTPFIPFAEWPRVPLDIARWDQAAARLVRQRGEAPPQAWDRVHQVALRAVTLDAAREADDSDLTVSGTESSWRQALAAKGMPGVQALYEAELRAHELVADAAGAGAALTEELLLRTHEELVASHEQYPVLHGDDIVLEEVPRGAYKTYENYGVLSNGAKRLYAPAERVPAEVARLMRETATDPFAGTHPAVQAGYLLYAVDSIHPFADGNGRVARAVASLPFYRAIGLPLVVTPRSRRAYLTALEAGVRSEYRGVVEFVYERGIDAMTRAFDILAASALS